MISIPDIFRGLSRARVRCLLVGGYASVVHGVPRTTLDIDLALDSDGRNMGWVLRVRSECHRERRHARPCRETLSVTGKTSRCSCLNRRETGRCCLIMLGGQDLMDPILSAPFRRTMSRPGQQPKCSLFTIASDGSLRINYDPFSNGLAHNRKLLGPSPELPGGQADGLNV